MLTLSATSANYFALCGHINTFSVLTFFAQTWTNCFTFAFFGAVVSGIFAVGRTALRGEHLTLSTTVSATFLIVFSVTFQITIIVYALYCRRIFTGFQSKASCETKFYVFQYAAGTIWVFPAIILGTCGTKESAFGYFVSPCISLLMLIFALKAKNLSNTRKNNDDFKHDWCKCIQEGDWRILIQVYL